MKNPTILIIYLLALLLSCEQLAASDDFLGKWVRMSQIGPISINFKDNGQVTGDFGDDGSIEITSTWAREGREIEFQDISGVECPGPGTYRISLTGNYLSFDYIRDDCGGRVKSMMGFWVRENYSEQINALTRQIEQSPSLEPLLERGRMYLALGKSADARKDFDRCLEYKTDDPLIYLHRASTRFPFDMEGIIEDCSRAIELEGDGLKNSYFLRGLALYELGDKEKACEDLFRAIELGFNILKVAEKEKCSEFWESLKKE